MELNLLFLPLLGGYIFYTRFNGTAYTAARVIGQRVIFHAAAFGLIFLGVAQGMAVATTWLITTNRDIAGIAATAVVSSSVLLITALILILALAIRSKSFRRETGWKKPVIGVLLAVVLVAETTVLFTTKAGGEIRPVVIVGSILTVAVSVLAATLRVFVREYRYEALVLRVSLFSVVICLLFLTWASMPGEVAAVWKLFSPVDFSGTAVMACVLGAFSPYALNLLWPYPAAVRRWHEAGKTSTLDRLLFEAGADGQLIQLSLADNKVYVGLIDWLDPSPSVNDAYFKVLPLMSGYRDTEKRTVTFTTYYDDIVSKYLETPDRDPSLHRSLDDFVKVIPYGQVLSAGRFREDVYLEFDAANSNKSDKSGSKSRELVAETSALEREPAGTPE